MGLAGHGHPVRRRADRVAWTRTSPLSEFATVSAASWLLLGLTKSPPGQVSEYGPAA